jgi:hypothetical protein
MSVDRCIMPNTVVPRLESVAEVLWVTAVAGRVRQAVLNARGYGYAGTLRVAPLWRLPNAMMGTRTTRLQVSLWLRAGHSDSVRLWRHVESAREIPRSMSGRARLKEVLRTCFDEVLANPNTELKAHKVCRHFLDVPYVHSVPQVPEAVVEMLTTIATEGTNGPVLHQYNPTTDSYLPVER